MLWLSSRAKPDNRRDDLGGWNVGPGSSVADGARATNTSLGCLEEPTSSRVESSLLYGSFQAHAWAGLTTSILMADLVLKGIPDLCRHRRRTQTTFYTPIGFKL